MFTLPDTKTDKEADKNGLHRSVDVFLIDRERPQRRFPFGCISIYVCLGLCLSPSWAM